MAVLLLLLPPDVAEGVFFPLEEVLEVGAVVDEGCWLTHCDNDVLH